MPQTPACSLSSVSLVPRKCFDVLAASKDADLPGAETDLGCSVHMCGQQADLLDTVMCFERIENKSCSGCTDALSTLPMKAFFFYSVQGFNSCVRGILLHVVMNQITPRGSEAFVLFSLISSFVHELQPDFEQLSGTFPQLSP